LKHGTTLTSRRDLMVLGGVLLLALTLRIYNYNGPGLWADEITVAQEMVGMPYLAIWEDPQKTYVDTILRQPWVKHFKNDIALRLPSLILGVASVWLIWLWSRRFGGQLILLPLAASLYVASNPSHIRYSQEGRYYITIYFLTAAMCYLLFRIKERPTRKYYLLLGANIPLLALTQRTCIMVPWVLFGSFAVAYWRELTRPQFRNLSICFAAGQLLSLPAYINVWILSRDLTAGRFGHPTASERLQEITPGYYGEAIAQSLRTDFAMLPSRPDGLVDWLVIALAIVGFGYLAYKSWRLAAFLSLSAFALVTAMLIAMKGTMLPHERYLYFAVPALHILTAAGVACCAAVVPTTGAFLRGANPRAIATAMLALGVTLPFLPAYYREMKYSYKQSGQLFKLAAGAQPFALIIPPFSSQHVRQLNWYFHELDQAKSEKLTLADVSTTAAIAAQITRWLESNGSEAPVVLGYATGLRSSSQDSLLASTLRALATEAKALDIPQHDGQSTFLLRKDIFQQPDMPSRLRESYSWLQVLDRQWNGYSQVRANLIAEQLKVLAKLPNVSREVVQESFTRIIEYSRNDVQKAQIYMQTDKLGEAEALLQKARSARPDYFFPYLLLAEIYEKQFLKSLELEHLRKAIGTMHDLRKNKVPPQPWFVNREVSLANLLEEAYVVKALQQDDSPTTAPRKQSLLNQYKGLPQKRLGNYVTSITLTR